MTENNSIQTAVLNECKERKILCRIFMSNGFQMQGEILAYDDSVVLMNIDGKQNVIYKHNISTIVPSRPLKCIN